MSEDGARKRPMAGLGRGLSALLGEVERDAPATRSAEHGTSLPLSLIDPNPDQPRRRFDEEKLEELSNSIALRGVLQPIVVRPVGDRYQIVAGERRWRAARRAKLREVPVVVRDFDEGETVEVALVENIQRQELNPIEEADAYRRLIREFGHSQEALGRLVHKSRSHIANLMRLLDLPEPVRASVAEGRLTMGHARAIVSALDPEALAREVEDRGLSVRETEALARRKRPIGIARTVPRETPASDESELAELERHLSTTLGLAVRITHGAGAGSLTISYSNMGELDMLCQRLSGEVI